MKKLMIFSAVQCADNIGLSTVQVILGKFLCPMSSNVMNKWVSTLEFVNLKGSNFENDLGVGNSVESYLGYARYNAKQYGIDLEEYLLKEDREGNKLQALFWIGWLYLTGKGKFPIEIEKGLSILKDTFDKGLMRAGVEYVLNSKEGKTNNWYKLVDVIKKCSTIENIFNYGAGICFLTGINGFPEERDEAYYYFKQAYLKADYRVCSLLSNLYENGLGVETNKVVASQLRVINKLLDQQELKMYSFSMEDFLEGNVDDEVYRVMKKLK